MVGQEAQDAIDGVLKDACSEEGMVYGEKYGPLWRTIRAELPIVSEDRMDAKGWIALPNGTLDPDSGELHSHDPEHYISRRAAIEYHPAATCPRWLRLLDNMVGDKPRAEAEQYKSFLQMWIGLALVGYRQYGSRALRKMLVIQGPPGTAKSTIADVVRQLLGRKNIAGDSVEQLSSRFGLETVSRSVAIVSDDAAGYDTKVRAEVFKKLITGEPLAADRKMKSIVNFRFQGPILLTTNNKPRVRDESDALYGRTTVLTFERVFTAENAREDLEGYGTALAYLDAYDEFPGILNWALDGLSMVKEMGEYPEIADAKEAADAWRAENDPVFAFLREHAEYQRGVYNFPLPVAAAISIYAETQMGSREFPTTRVAQILGRNISTLIPGVRREKKRISGEQARCYEGLKLLDSGLRYVNLARERGLLPNQYTTNEVGL